VVGVTVVVVAGVVGGIDVGGLPPAVVTLEPWVVAGSVSSPVTDGGGGSSAAGGPKAGLVVRVAPVREGAVDTVEGETEVGDETRSLVVGSLA
jgi:hypothetical protein